MIYLFNVTDLFGKQIQWSEVSTRNEGQNYNVRW